MERVLQRRGIMPARKKEAIVNGVRYDLPIGPDDTSALGVMFGDLIVAFKACGDTSVLEVLYPWFKETPEGKKIFKEKATERGKETAKKIEKKVSKKKGSFTFTLSNKEAQILHTILANIEGSLSGPRGVADKVVDELERKGIGYFDVGFDGKIGFGDWDELDGFNEIEKGGY